jgi:hypothetical protein
MDEAKGGTQPERKARHILYQQGGERAGHKPEDGRTHIKEFPMS